MEERKGVEFGWGKRNVIFSEKCFALKFVF